MEIKSEYSLAKDLPSGRTEFDVWQNEVLEAAGCPLNDSTRFALAVMVLHLGETDCDKPKEFFMKKLKKAMTAQVASAVINELKEKQQAQEAAAKAANEQPKS